MDIHYNPQYNVVGWHQENLPEGVRNPGILPLSAVGSHALRGLVSLPAVRDGMQRDAEPQRTIIPCRFCSKGHTCPEILFFFMDRGHHSKVE